MRRATLVSAATLAVAAAAAPLLADQQPALTPGQMDTSLVTAGTYSADPAHTLVGWRLNHLGFNDYFGLFGSIEGTLTIDPAHPEDATLAVTIPVARITTASDELEEHLMRPGKDGAAPDFFGPDPAAATFVSTTVTVDSATDQAQITGDLTLNGVTRPVTIAAQYTGAGTNPLSGKQTVGFEGTATLKRSEFGLGNFVPLVSDEVELQITAAFEKQ